MCDFVEPNRGRAIDALPDPGTTFPDPAGNGTARPLAVAGAARRDPVVLVSREWKRDAGCMVARRWAADRDRGLARRPTLLKPSPMRSPGFWSLAPKQTGLPLQARRLLPSSRVMSA